MDIKNITVSAIIAAIVAVVGVTAFVKFAAPTATPPFGAITSPQLPFHYLCVGNECTYSANNSLTVGTTTPCVIKTPAATSTVTFAGIQLDTASSAATVWSLGIASTAYATTTQIGTNYTVAGSAQATITASSTIGAAANVMTIAPNQYLVWSETGGITAGDSGTGFVPKGSCVASFKTFN